MRESSGNSSEGRDVTVAHPTASNAEAGLYQVSFDSIGGSPWLTKLYEQYQRAPNQCLLSVYMDGVKDRKAQIVGVGPGAAFQEFMKGCPAFATAYAAVLFRVNRAHFGPIKRKEAELAPACEAMLKDVETKVVTRCP